ncbi:MAG: tetratricopeptide repeat protein [Candidatus Binatia bacterium]
MIWNPFKKKKINPERNIVDELANSLAKKGEIQYLEAELGKLDVNDLNKKEVEAWHHLYGICAFQRSEHELAAERFKKGLDACPESHQIKFSLAQEYIFLGQPQKAFPLFDECSFPQVSQEFALATSR